MLRCFLKLLLTTFACLSLSMSGAFVRPSLCGVLDKFKEGAAASSQNRKQGEQGAKKRTALSSECKSKMDESQSGSKGSERAIELLISKARAKGSVHIIVGLCVEFVPEGNLTNPRAVQAQRQAIALAQNKLLRRLSAYKVTSIKKYEFMPFIAMQVDAPALRFLKASSQIASIEEDMQVPPTN